MKNIKAYIYSVCFLIVLCFVGCKKTDFQTPVVYGKRTIFVYMAADNNLSSYAQRDLDKMKTGMAQVDPESHLIVYADIRGRDPQLLQVTEDTIRVVEQYEEENSASVEIFAQKWARVQQLFPSDSYGMVLWSHASGWVPANVLLKSASRGSVGVYGSEIVGEGIWSRDPDALMTKWFGQDGSDFMDISDLAAALPKSRELEFLVFDACFMSNVETLYELRHATKYVLASASELLAEGIPYDQVLPVLFAETPQLEQFCRLFMNFHEQSNLDYAMVSLVQMDQLDALAAAAKAFYNTADPSAVDPDAVQYFENMSAHVFFDLEDYYSQMHGDSTLLAAFVEQLGRAVRYHDSTPYVYSAYSGSSSHLIKVNTCCGLSTYIPRDITGLELLQPAYLETSWAKTLDISY